MRIVDKVKSIGGEKARTFPAAVKELAEKDKEGKVVIYEKSGMKTKYLDEVAVVDALDIAGDIERALSEEHGGGEYQLSLFKKDSQLVEKFNYGIAGAPKGRRSSAGKEAQKEKASTSEERYFRLLELTIASKSSTIEDLARLAEAAKVMKGDDKLTPKDLVELANALRGEGGGTEMLTAYMEGIQTGRELSPQLEREDPLLALAGPAMSLIGQIFAARQGGAGQGEVQRLEQELRSKIAAASTGTVVSPGPTPEHPLAPGASVAGVGEPSQDMPIRADSSTPPLARTHDYFMERFITPFRRDVAEGQSDDDLAYQLIAMVTYARDRMADNPPPIVADFVAARTIPEYSAALATFFSALPELANLTQKQEAITKCLMRMLMYRPPEQPTEEAIEDVEDADTETIGDTQVETGPAEEHHQDIAADSSHVRQEDVRE